MLRFVSYDIVFQEVPGEITLAINLSNCPNDCKGCHSPHLKENVGEMLSNNVLLYLIEKYGIAITCICFMGGDSSPKEVESLSLFLREQTKGRIKTGWYSGKNTFPEDCSPQSFDYLKLGAYIDNLGGLDAVTTNQRFYRIENGNMIDETDTFQKHKQSKTWN
jgi:anaerobic ribonucleoside-triphosphate reductase activating protein